MIWSRQTEQVSGFEARARELRACAELRLPSPSLITRSFYGGLICGASTLPRLADFYLAPCGATSPSLLRLLRPLGSFPHLFFVDAMIGQEGSASYEELNEDMEQVASGLMSGAEEVDEEDGSSTILPGEDC